MTDTPDETVGPRAVAPGQLNVDALTPERIGILNGRAAALQAATADLLDRGYLHENAEGRLGVTDVWPRSVTPLQATILDALERRVPRLERVSAVHSALDDIQRKAMHHGLLKRRWRRIGSLRDWVLITLVILASAFLIAVDLFTRNAVLAMVATVVFIVVVGKPADWWLKSLPRKVSQQRTRAGTRLLAEARSRYPYRAPGMSEVRTGGLGRAVALYGSRPLLVAFPAAATLGWALDDGVGDDVHAQAADDAGVGSDGGEVIASPSDWSFEVSPSESGGVWCSSTHCCGIGADNSCGGGGGGGCGG